MKKIFSGLIAVLYIMFYFTGTGLASELYFIKDANKTSVLPVVQNSFKNSGYTLNNEDPVYGTKGIYNVVAVIEQSDSNVYYYIDNTVDATLNKSILKSIKGIGLKYKKVKDDDMALSFSKTIYDLKRSKSSSTQSANKYNFSESKTTANKPLTNVNQQTTSYNFEEQEQKDPEALTGFVAQIPAGTTFDTYLQTSVNTATAQKGDEVIAVLTKNWVYKGYVVAEQGSKVIGYVTKSNAAGMAYRDGKVKIGFNELQTVDGKIYPIKTEEIEFKVDSDGKVSSAAGRVIGGAAVGALLGLLFGALSNDSSNIGKSVAIGAGIGAGIGTGSAAMERGTDAEIPVYTEMSLKLTSPLKAVLSD